MSTEAKTDSKIENLDKPEIHFNERTLEEVEKEKLDLPHGVVSEKERHDKFKSKFKEEKGALQITIKSMHRRPIISFDKNGNAVKKDVLTYVSEFHGYDWLGNDLWIRDHIDGVYYEPRFRVTTTLDPQTGDHIPNKVFDGMIEEYYVELTEKPASRLLKILSINAMVRW
jgi:hypothetical protein